jgi:hypothetical protein
MANENNESLKKMNNNKVNTAGHFASSHWTFSELAHAAAERP